MGTTSTTQITQLLVVDPRPEDYLHLEDQLADASVRIAYCITGEEALLHPRESRGNLWLVNSQLRDMTGLELLSLVRSRDPSARCVLVGDAYSETDEVAARQMGATLYVCKPPQIEWVQAVPRFRGARPDDLAQRSHQPLAAAKGTFFIRPDASLRCKPDS